MYVVDVISFAPTPTSISLAPSLSNQSTFPGFLSRSLSHLCVAVTIIQCKLGGEEVGKTKATNVARFQFLF
jgi:hypothetical protein